MNLAIKFKSPRAMRGLLWHK